MESSELKTIVFNLTIGSSGPWQFFNTVRIKNIAVCVMGTEVGAFRTLKIIFPEFQNSTTGELAESTFVVPIVANVCTSISFPVSIVTNVFELGIADDVGEGFLTMLYEDVVG